jgi:hypothetical protein
VRPAGWSLATAMPAAGVHRRRLIAAVPALLLAVGCEQSAAGFFSGRPSGMAMVHNRIIGGPPEAMLALLQVPLRFPDASAAHVADWQESVIAWWRHPEKHDLLLASSRRLSAAEAHALLDWLRAERSGNQDKALLLIQIASAVGVARSAHRGGRMQA